MSKKPARNSTVKKSTKAKTLPFAAKPGKPLLSGVVSLATGESNDSEPLSAWDPDKVNDIALRFKTLIEETVDLMGPEDAAKFLISATAMAFGGDDELADSFATALNDLGELVEPRMEVYRLKVSLHDAPVKIERLIEVPDCSLGYLNEVIQAAFGWTNSHLHVFDMDREQFGPPMDDNLGMVEWQDENTVRLSDLLPTKKKKLIYTYDMGDDWRHQIEIVSKTPIEKRPLYAITIEGKGHEPPEDCGGVWGYAEMLGRLKSGTPEEFDFLESNYDPDFFDLKKANARLKQIKWKDFH